MIYSQSIAKLWPVKVPCAAWIPVPDDTHDASPSGIIARTAPKCSMLIGTSLATSAAMYATQEAKSAFPRQMIVGENATFGPTLLTCPCDGASDIAGL